MEKLDKYTEESIAYAEVCEVLSYMEKEQLNKVPSELLSFFYKNRKKGHISRIDKDDIFNKDNISRKALSILAYINMNYWASEEHKIELRKIYQINEFKLDLERREKYSVDVFKK